MNKSNSRRDILLGGSALMAAAAGGTPMAQAQAPQRPATPAQAPAPAGGSGQRQPNILVIMGDDVGWFNVGAYHQGIMSSRTPNLDRLAAAGLRFTDYYAEASCTAGRANFITGELPIRTGLTTVGQAGAAVGMPAQAVTLATVLKSMGYKTGQFGKNHLGDRNEYLPTLHGFDEFFGYLYHLDAMSDPYWYSFPTDRWDEIGPRNLVHTWATDTDDATEMPRWGRVGRQRIEDEGPLPPFPNMENRQNWQPGRPSKYNMESFDSVLVDHSKRFMDVVGGDAPSAKDAALTLATIATSRKVLVVADRNDTVSWKSLRNLDSVHLLEPGQLNTYDVLVSDDVVFTEEALAAFVAGPPSGKSVKASATSSEAEAAELADTVAVAKPAKAAKPAVEVEAAEDADGDAPDFGPDSHLALEDGSEPDGYPIKGNASSKLYHVPGSAFYKRTVAEVWFTTAEAAEAAGFQLPPSQRAESEES